MKNKISDKAIFRLYVKTLQIPYHRLIKIDSLYVDVLNSRGYAFFLLAVRFRLFVKVLCEPIVKRINNV